MGTAIDQIPTTSPQGWGRIDREYDLADAENHLGHPVLADVLRLWKSLCRNGEPPSREDLDGLILRPGVFPQVLLIEGVERHGRRDLRYRLIGAGLAANFGDDMTGRYVRDVYSDENYADGLVALGFMVIEGRRPIATSARLVIPNSPDEPTMLYRLAVPLQKLPSGTPLLLVCQMCVWKGEIVERPAQKIYAYEPISTVAFIDRERGIRK